MPYREVSFAEGEFYHIYNRGNSKQKIFLDDHDRERFAKLLYLCNSKVNVNYREDIIRAKIDAFDFERGESIVYIGAWVLMPNHFHIYLSPKDTLFLPKPGFGKNSVTEFMHKLLTAYSKYFNKKHKRTGGLFESNFKAVHIQNDPQAKYNFSYIHLNPVKLVDKDWKENGLKNFDQVLEFLENYKWSSYLDYKGKVRAENKILNKEKFAKYFQDSKDFNEEIREWLKFQNK